jgi:hypothetical protein
LIHFRFYLENICLHGINFSNKTTHKNIMFKQN